MKNADVEMGQAYAWSEHEPSIREKGAKVTALAQEKKTQTQRRGESRQVTMVRVRYEEDHRLWNGRVVPAGTEAHVPARQLWGSYEERAARTDGYLDRKAEAEQIRDEVIDTLQRLDIIGPEERPRVFARVGGGSFGLAVEVSGAEACQRLSDALSYALSAREVQS